MCQQADKTAHLQHMPIGAVFETQDSCYLAKLLASDASTQAAEGTGELQRAPFDRELRVQDS